MLGKCYTCLHTRSSISQSRKYFLGSFPSEPMVEMPAIALHYLLQEITHHPVLGAKVDYICKEFLITIWLKAVV